MASVIMNMSDYTSETDAAYGEEVLCAGWNPALDLVSQETVSVRADRNSAMPSDLAAMDVEQFVRRMYVYLSYE